MHNTDLINTIKYKYNIEDFLEMKNLDGYPHIFTINSKNYSYIAKLIELSKTYCKDINKFYSDIKDNKYILIPKKNIDDEYSVKYSDGIALLYDKKNNTNVKPDYSWCARCLASIHLSEINSNNLISYRDNIYNETLDILKKSHVYMDKEIREKINLIFNKIQCETLNANNEFVLCHNDPYNQNVLVSENLYKIIDTDGMGLSKKEYDIQRLLYNYAINCRDASEVNLFFSKFKEVYENETNKKIDINLFKNLYYCDFIRSIAWLYLVSNDNTRRDVNRQKKQLVLYNKSILNNIHETFINQI